MAGGGLVRTGPGPHCGMESGGEGRGGASDGSGGHGAEKSSLLAALDSIEDVCSDDGEMGGIIDDADRGLLIS